MTIAKRLAAILKLAAISGLAGLTAACGFTPIYADHSESIIQSLASIDIPRIESTNEVGFNGSDAGYMLESELQRLISSDGRVDYVLDIELTERLSSEAITKEANTERYSLQLSAEYELLDSLGEVVLKNERRSYVSYGVVDSPYATQVARENATRTAAESIAADIERDLILHFKGAQAPSL